MQCTSGSKILEGVTMGTNPVIGNELQRALMPMLLLAEMANEPGHGYGLAARIAEKGFQRIKGAKLYPILAKLESAGYCKASWVEGDLGPGKKIYTITDSGIAQLTQLASQWAMVSKMVVKTLEKYVTTSKANRVANRQNS